MRGSASYQLVWLLPSLCALYMFVCAGYIGVTLHPPGQLWLLQWLQRLQWLQWLQRLQRLQRRLLPRLLRLLRPDASVCQRGLFSIHCRAGVVQWRQGCYAIRQSKSEDLGD